jgi:hypothetical protein
MDLHLFFPYESTPLTRKNYLLNLFPYSLLHSLHFFFSFFLILYLILLSIPLPTVSSQILCPNPHIPFTHSHYQPIPLPSVSSSLDSIPLTFLSKPSFVVYGFRPSRAHSFLISFILLLAGDVEVNPGPPSPSFINLSHLNTRSSTSITPDLDKPASIQEFISDNNLNLLSLSETWLPPDTLPSTLNSLTPPNFSIINSPRTTGRGGGLAVIFHSNLSVSKLITASFTSFESLSVRVTTTLSTNPFSFILLTIYRPPSSSKATFISEFATLLEDLATSPSEIVITGDFNVHVDEPNCPTVSPFINLLDAFSLTQHIHFPTHTSGHTLDLLITRSTSSIILSTSSSDPAISDHHAIHFSISTPSLPKTHLITKLVRCFRSINIDHFSTDIKSSPLASTLPTSLKSYLTLFNTTLSSILDKHAPFKTIACSSRPHKPFITPDILAEKSKRSKLETLHRRNKNDPASCTEYKTQARHVAKLIAAAKRTYYRNIISQHSTHPKKLWSSLDSLLSRKVPPVLPNAISPFALANSFLEFFDQKITKLCSSFSCNPNNSPHINPPFAPPSLSVFIPATTDEVRQVILDSSNSTCSLDTIPTFLLKSCLDSLLLPITNIINLSLSEGIFPDSFKLATVRPLLKKHNLPHDDLSSYRPISNLSFLSKLLERIIHSRINLHLQTFPSLCPFQSAYRKYHSTETALLRIHNDLLLASNEQQVSALVLLDLSAAFDTIDHHILLTRLNSTFGLSGSALSLLSSYLTDRFQYVTIANQSSAQKSLSTGVPQGSVLGPLLFSLYTSPIAQLLTKYPISFHLYADDTQLYISFSGPESSSALSSLSSALDSVYEWLTLNRLTVNPSKTEYLLIGTSQQRSKVMNSSIAFRGTSITPSSHARNLGVEFDSDHSFNHHISNICRSSYYQIRQLRQIRSSLDITSAKLLANALVSSKLDYCNSLLYNLPNSSLNRLQHVQNSLARAVVPSTKRSDHITPTLIKLHWLPLKQRIDFKIATITYKTLQNNKPSYLLDLLKPYTPSRSLRSSNTHLLEVPFIKTALGRRSFSFAAPTIWNSLPLPLRTSQSLQIFTSKLKTHLFPP